MSKLEAFIRQPSTLIAIGCVIGGVVYWFTGNASLALASISIVPGTVNDQTASVLAKVEALEDAARAKQAA
jgi:hypothetical protein